MPDVKDLPYLLKLLDDDSDTVQEHILGALKSFGPTLESIVGPYLNDLPEQQVQYVRELAYKLRVQAFERNWTQWIDELDESIALEYALSQLAFMEFGAAETRLEQHIDELVDRFHALDLPILPEALMYFLFQEEGFTGPPRDFHDPIKNNLVHVIQEKEGTQISLTALALIMGNRLGIELEGVSVPGHFLIMHHTPGRIQMFNPFSRGVEMTRDSVQSIVQSHYASESTRNQDLHISTHEIVLMILRNQIHSCCWKSWPERAQVYVNLFEGLIRELKGRGVEV